MGEIIEREFVCQFCNKKFPSARSRGGHIRIHLKNYNKRLVDQGEKMVIDSQSDTGTSSGPTNKRSKNELKHSSSESFSNGRSSFSSEIDQEAKNASLSLVMLSRDSIFKKGHNLVLKNNSENLETRESLWEQLKTDAAILSDSDSFISGPKKSDSAISVDGSIRNTGFGSCEDTNKTYRSSDSKSPMVEEAIGANKNCKVHKCPICFKVFSSGNALGGHKKSHNLVLKNNSENQDLKRDAVEVDDQLRSADDDDSGAILSDFISGPKKSESDILVDGSTRNTEFGSCADTNSKTHRSQMVGANKNSKGHKCSICFKVFSSGNALGGHKKSHKADAMQFDLNLPAPDIDE